METYSMFQPIVKHIYNAEEGFVFEGPDERRWRDPINYAEDKYNTLTLERIFTFDTPVQFKSRTYTKYISHKYDIVMGVVGDLMYLEVRDISKDEPLFSFKKTMPGKKYKPTLYQLWDRKYPGEKTNINIFINTYDMTFPDWIFWDGNIMESMPAQIYLYFPKDREEEAIKYIEKYRKIK